MASATALQPLRNYIRQNIGHLRATPCLLISSTSPPSVSTAVAGTKNPASLSTDEKQQKQHKQQLKFQQQQNDPKTHVFVERNIQSIQLEFNLRTVPCTISSAFPTTDGVNEAVSLAKRFGLKEGQFGSGDGLIIGIGSGAAIDLAKAVADTLFGNIASCKDDGINQQEGSSNLVLAPSTLGGFMAASSNTPSLLLDTKEEMILPHLTPSWTTAVGGGHCRQGTVVTLDQQMSLPPLYSPLQPPKRSESFPGPSMAHYAAAILSILLDVARILDENSTQQSINTALLKDMKAVASASSSVLQLAAKEANGSNSVQEGDSYETAQQHILSAIPRLSAVVDQSCHLLQGPTVPQRLANALLPQYFPSCHLVTYLASILPGLCESVATQPALNVEDKVSVLEELTKSIFSCIDDGGKTDGRVSAASLVSWASQITEEAAIPTMASLAYGTPDLHALTGSFDSYDALVGSMTGENTGIRASSDDFALVEDILNRSLNR